jgi:NAD(P)-dependent dehydrogenase (short-subunit alcohol dehydrogenase family)
MDLAVSGRGYLIVGGTAGMGLATAEVLVAEGANVAVVGRNSTRAEAAVAKLGADHTIAIVGDVAIPGESERVVDEAAAAMDGLAGIAVTTGTGSGSHSNLEGASDEVWSAAVDDILLGIVRTVRAAVPHLVAGGGGTVVTTGAYGIHAYHPDRLPYVTLKSGVVAFTKTIAKAYGPFGIRANCVCPGVVETDGLAYLRDMMARERGVPPEGLLEQVMVDEWHMDVALGRPGRPTEVGELFAFLLSPRAGYLTGATINIDGGTNF